METRLDREVDRRIEQDPQSFQYDVAEMEIRLRDDFTLYGEGAKGYPHLGGHDSYYWVRVARNYLRHGTTCDAVVDGECRDELTSAPVGGPMLYSESLHIVAIVALHRLIAVFRDGVPVSVTAMFVPIILGVLGVIPAFFVGRRLAGDLGGFCASLAIGLSPILLERSLGADNDIWNVVLPLFMLWAIVEALALGSWKRQLPLAVLAAFFATCHAATWSGWVFFFAVVVAGLSLAILIDCGHFLVARRSLAFWRQAALRRPLVVGATFVAATLTMTGALGIGDEVWRLPDEVLQRLFGSGKVPLLVQSGETVLFPSLFSTVNELQDLNGLGIANFFGGMMALGGVLGLVVLALPRARWRPSDLALLIAVALGFVLTISGFSPPDAWISRFLGLSVVIALALRSFEARERDALELGPEAIVIAWFLGALTLSFGGSRFILLLVVPFGLAFGAAAGGLHREIARALRWILGKQPLPVAILAALPVLAATAFFLLPGYRHAVGYVPAMDNAWWSSFKQINEESPDDAIVTTPWSQGHWAKYVAERPTTADGATLQQKRMHFWLTRALVTHDERESIGLLRMLNCGSDAAPRAEERHGAFGKLVALGLTPREAYRAVIAVAGLERTAARDWLAGLGLTTAGQEDVLESTHCDPPTSYLVLSDKDLWNAYAWLTSGLWDPEKATVVALARQGLKDEARALLLETEQVTPEQAAVFVRKARRARLPAEVAMLVAPPYSIDSRRWQFCDRQGDQVTCPINLPTGVQPGFVQAFNFPANQPDQGRLVFRNAETGEITEGSPGVVLVARIDQLEELPIADADVPEIGVLIDPIYNRVYLGASDYVRSMLFQLILLEGRHTAGFEKLREFDSTLHGRVQTWRLDFGAESADSEP